MSPPRSTPVRTFVAGQFLLSASVYASVRSSFGDVREYAGVYNLPVTWEAKSPVTVGVGELPTSPTIVVPASAFVIPLPASTAKLLAVCSLGACAEVLNADARKSDNKMTGFFILSLQKFSQGVSKCGSSCRRIV